MHFTTQLIKPAVSCVQTDGQTGERRVIVGALQGFEHGLTLILLT
jgi:hypothetical protein